jgi:hypothetical protein
MRYPLIALIILLLSSCQAFVGNDEQVILEADLQAYGTEASNIRSDMQSNRTAVAATVAVASTQAAEFNRYNDTLRATVIIANPPLDATRIVVQDVQGPLPIEMYDISDGEMRFVEVDTSAQVDDQNCFLIHESFFSMGINTIYMTAFALNLQAGAVVRVDWQYGNELVQTTTWVAPQSAVGQCVALALRSSDTELAAGNWTATLYVNGEATDPATFSIIGG